MEPKAVKIGCVIALIIEIAGLIVFEICPGTLISIFNATPELHEIGDSALRIIAIHFPMAAIGITLSTLFIKQHSALDVITALIVCVPLWFAVYGRRGIPALRDAKRAK